jgi:hypothetical protein
MESLVTTRLMLPDVEALAKTLKLTGRLAESFGGLAYLDVDDAYIHELFPILSSHAPNVQKPDYFGKGSIGAHITVTYPEEGVLIRKEDLGQEHKFKITGLYTSELITKKYYVLQVTAPSLLALRRSYGLPDKLQFLNRFVDFHITIGFCPLFALD